MRDAVEFTSYFFTSYMRDTIEGLINDFVCIIFCKVKFFKFDFDRESIERLAEEIKLHPKVYRKVMI